MHGKYIYQLTTKLSDGTVSDVCKGILFVRSNIATDAALETLTNRVTTAEGEIDTLQTQVGEGTVSKQIDDKIAALNLIETYDAKGAADAVDQKLATEIQTARGAEQANATAAAKAQSDVDALKASVGTVPAEKTVVKMIEEAQTAATYDDTALKNRVAANETAIETLNGDATKEGSVANRLLMLSRRSSLMLPRHITRCRRLLRGLPIMRMMPLR